MASVPWIAFFAGSLSARLLSNGDGLLFDRRSDALPKVMYFMIPPLQHPLHSLPTARSSFFFSLGKSIPRHLLPLLRTQPGWPPRNGKTASRRVRLLPIGAALGLGTGDDSNQDCTRSEGWQGIMHR